LGRWLGRYAHAGGELPDGGDELFDAAAEAGVYLFDAAAEAGVYLFDAGCEALVRLARFGGVVREAFVGLDHPCGELCELALGVAPQLAVFLVVFAVLFGEAGGNVLDAVEAFFGGHGLPFAGAASLRIAEWRAAPLV